MRQIIAWYDSRMQTTIAAIGPYRLKVTKTEKGISNVEIFKEPKGKTKKLDKFSIQNTKIVQLETLIGVPLDVTGTVFQKKVWKATAKIPHGETRTYADIAKTIGHPKAVRAVGTALGKNPTCILVPCHRVVPSSGGIGNYAYGKAMKKWLLDREAVGA